MKVWLGRGTSQNTSAQARAPLQRLHVGTHSRPIIQQDRSSEAIVSAISQLHLLSVLLAILRSSCLRASSRGTGPSIQQDQSSGAVASAISQLHLLFVLLALLHRGGRSSKHPSESIQQGQCVCIITLALAARPDGVFSTILALLLHQSTSAPSMATTALNCSTGSPVPVRHAAAMSSAHGNTYGKQ